MDAEYVVHHNRPTLGGIGAKNRSTAGGRRLDKVRNQYLFPEDLQRYIIFCIQALSSSSNGGQQFQEMLYCFCTDYFVVS